MPSETKNLKNDQKKSNANPIKEKLKKILIYFERVPLSQKLFFIKNLQVMVKAGLPLSLSIRTLSRQTPNKKLRSVLLDVYKKIEKGNSLSKCLSEYPDVFSEIFTNMIEAGEKSGNLENVLTELALQLKKTHDLIAKIKGALTYPIFVISAMIGIGSLMMIFVVPKVIVIFSEFSAELPLPTRILISLSNFIGKNGIWLIFIFIILTVLFIKYIKTKNGKKNFHKILLKMPIFSTIIKKINLARFSRTFCSLLTTDIPIVETLEITSRVLGNVIYREYVAKAAESIKRGESISEVLALNSSIFPPVVTQMIEVGEKTGTMDNILKDLAEFYEEEVSQTMASLSSIIEPILIVILGVAVAGMAVAIIMPMYSLTQQI